MPKLPKGMYRRGRVYYLRVQRGGRDPRRSLGSIFEEVVRAFRGLRRRPELLEDGRITVREAIERWLSSAVASRRFHVHMMRHTFASRWVEAGGNLAVLQVLLGHSSILVTRRYAQLSDEAVLQEADRISRKSGKESGTVRTPAELAIGGSASEATA